MSLLPAMVASRADSQANPEYYFVLGGGVNGPVSASSFVATGAGEPNSDGRFIARGDASAGAPALGFQLRKGGAQALQQWSIGMTDAPAGANSGNNFAISAYDDASVLLSTPLSINRASGQVVVNTGLTVDGDVVFSGNVDLSGSNLWANSIDVNTEVSTGLPTTVGGGNIEVVGTLGVSRVYDAIYNPPETGADVLLFSAAADGVAPVSSNTYTPVRSGLHILSLTVQAYAPGFVWTPGTTALLYGLTYNAGASIEAGAQLYCPLISNPAGMPAIGPLGPNLVEYQNDILVNLTAGRTYAIAAASTGAPNLGASGNVGVVIQPVYA